MVNYQKGTYTNRQATINPFLHIYSIQHIEEKNLRKTLWEKVKLLKWAISLFSTMFSMQSVSKSFNSHILVVVCSFFEFGTASKWCIWEWVNPFPNAVLNWNSLQVQFNEKVKKVLQAVRKHCWKRRTCVLQAIFSSTGHRPASLCHGPLSVVRACVRPSVRPCVNFFFKHLLRWNYYWILLKFHRNVPTMVLFRISWNNLIPSKTLVAMATKLKIFWNLWKSSCQKP